jgi:uncharacterized protein with HEPN domain
MPIDPDPDPDPDRTQLARVEALLYDIAQQTKRREMFADPAARRELRADRLAIEATARELKRLRESRHSLRSDVRIVRRPAEQVKTRR